MKCHLLVLHPLVPLILWIVMCCFYLFHISLLMFTGINFWMELVFNNQPVVSFLMSMCGSLNKNLRWRMTSFCSHTFCTILTFSMILSFLFNLVKIQFLMLLLSIIRRNRGMPISHLNVERQFFSSSSSKFLMQFSSLLFWGFIQTSNILVCIGLCFLFVGNLLYLSSHAFPRLHRPANALMVALEVQLYVSFAYALFRLGVGVVFLLCVVPWFFLLCVTIYTIAFRSFILFSAIG